MGLYQRHHARYLLLCFKGVWMFAVGGISGRVSDVSAWRALKIDRVFIGCEAAFATILAK